MGPRLGGRVSTDLSLLPRPHCAETPGDCPQALSFSRGKQMSQAVVPRGPGCGKQVLALSPSQRALYDGRANTRESLEKEVISHPEKKFSPV